MKIKRFLGLFFIFLIVLKLSYVSSFESYQQNITVDPDKRFILWQNIAWSGKSDEWRRRIPLKDSQLPQDYPYWENWIENFIIKEYNNGVRRFQFHNPFGQLSNEVMIFDQFIDSHYKLYGDINRDGIINSVDLELFSLAKGSMQHNFTKDDSNYNKYADLDLDGDVDSDDEELLLPNVGYLFDWEFNRPLGDLNYDGIVDENDLNLIESKSGYDKIYDLNRDGKIDSTDRAILEKNIGAKILPKDDRILFCDLDHDGICNFGTSDDRAVLRKAMDSFEGDSNYNPQADFDRDGDVDSDDNETLRLNHKESVLDTGVPSIVNDFRSSWSEFFEEYDDVEVIMYIGAPHNDRDQNALENNLTAWWERADRALYFMEDLPFSLGADNFVARGDESMTFTLAEKLRSEGTKVYVEAKPDKEVPEWYPYGALGLAKTWYDRDPNSVPFELNDRLNGKSWFSYKWDPDELIDGEIMIAFRNLEYDRYPELLPYYLDRGYSILTYRFNMPEGVNYQNPGQYIDVHYPNELPTIINLDPENLNSENLNYVVTKSPTNGNIVRYNATQSKLLYRPFTTFNGTDSFSFIVTDNVTNSSEDHIAICYEGYNVNCENFFELSNTVINESINDSSQENNETQEEEEEEEDEDLEDDEVFLDQEVDPSRVVNTYSSNATNNSLSKNGTSDISKFFKEFNKNGGFIILGFVNVLLISYLFIKYLFSD